MLGMSTKPDDIRAAARRLFLRHGFTRVSMDTIAAEAGVSKQTVYRYYETKSNLFSAVLGETADGMRADILDLVPREALSTEELVATLVAVGDRILDRVLDPIYLDLFRVVLAESREFPQLLDQFRTAVIERGAQALEQLLRSAGPTRPPEVQRFFIGCLLS